MRPPTMPPSEAVIQGATTLVKTLWTGHEGVQEEGT